MDEPLTGSCLCGGVRFEITRPFRRANHCHCSRCRKHSGAFGLTQGRVARDGFRLLRGEELIRVYRPEGGMAKAFCSVCGSSLFGGTWPDGPEVSVRFGALGGGADVDEAKESAKAYAAERALPFFEDGAEPLQYDAYGAIGDEILDQLDEPPRVVVVPVGNGALLGGVGRAVGRRSPSTLRVGVAAKDAPVMALSWQARRPVPSDRSATIPDRPAVRAASP